MSASGGRSYSHAGPTNFYGGLTYGAPYQAWRRYIGPLAQGLGVSPEGRFANRYGQQSGPLLDYINQLRGFTGSQIPQALAAGQNIAEQAPQLYGNLQGQINSALGALPGLQAGAGNISDQAKFLVDQAFSPITSRALFQETMNRALEPLRAGQAARGLLEQGTGQQTEQDVAQNLAYQQAQNDFAQQQAALGGYGQALQNQLGFAQAGIPLAQTGLEGLGTLGQLQQFGLNLPMSTAGNLFSLLTGGLAPGLQLSQITGPQQASNAKSFNQSAGL